MSPLRMVCLFLVALWISIGVMAVPVAKTSEKEKITNTDILPPYAGAPPTIELTPAQKERLAQGKPVYPPIEDKGESGGGVAIFKVKAPPEIIWKTIARFDQYPAWVDGVKKTTYYKQPQGDNIYVQFTVGKWFTPSYTYHIAHHYPGKKTGWGTWALDDGQPNDLLACRGFWRVTTDVDNPNQSVVEYAVNLKGKGMMMEIARPILLKNGVKNATSWLTKQAETAFAEHLTQEKLVEAKEPVLEKPAR